MFFVSSIIIIIITTPLPLSNMCPLCISSLHPLLSDVCWEDRTGSCFSGPNETVAGEFFCCPEDSDYGFSGGAENGYPCIAGDSYSGVLECQD